MRIEEMVQKIGQHADFTELGEDREGRKLVFLVEIVGAKHVFGVPKFEVIPVAGAGTRWVNATSLTFNEETV